MHKPKLLAISGATASGKTKLAIELALKYNAEIISFDSRQIYKELNIGVARPSKEELSQVRHHLIAYKSIADDYSVQRFIEDVHAVLNSPLQTVCNYILVGGTGFYLKALWEGIDDLPNISIETREKIENEFREKGIVFLQEKVKTIDPQSYSAIDTQNPRRLQRILEIWEEHRLVYSELIQQSKGMFPPLSQSYEVKNIVIDLPRELLYQRIHQRVEAMKDNGLITEAESLYPHRNLNALNTVGYKELFAYFDGEMNLTEAVDKIKQHTRNYAKRQITWNKKYLNKALWVNPIDNPHYIEDIEHYINS